MQKRFPAGWKFTKVLPLHKKLSQLEMSNYRPVAILSPLSKVLEKIIYKQIYNYFTTNKLFHPTWLQTEQVYPDSFTPDV